MSEITNYDDYIDSRNVEEQIVELQKIVKTLEKSKEERDAKYLEEVQEELVGLLDLKKQYVDDYGVDSWGFGAQFIRHDYFEDYAREFAEDCGLITDDMKWPATHIDWEAAAEEMAQDYSEVDFSGVIYLTREA